MLKGKKKIGRVSLIGLGLGAKDYRTLSCCQILSKADDLIGYGFYLDQLDILLPHQTLHRSDNGQELARAKLALELAARGRHVALISSGDPGVFAMAAAFFEVLEQFSDKNYKNNKKQECPPEPSKTTSAFKTGLSDQMPDHAIDIVVEPGITAALGAAAWFGAPLGGDFAILSLSDNLKPWHLIEKRLRLIAQADMALALYNPVSKARPHQIEQAIALLRQEKSPSTLIGLGTDISRSGEQCALTTLDALDISSITSRTVLLIGTSQSRSFSYHGRLWFYTPRSYTTS